MPRDKLCASKTASPADDGSEHNTEDRILDAVFQKFQNQDKGALHDVVQGMNSQTLVTQDKQVTLITLPNDGATIYAVPEDQFIVQNRDGSISVPPPDAEKSAPSETVHLLTET